MTKKKLICVVMSFVTILGFCLTAYAATSTGFMIFSSNTAFVQSSTYTNFAVNSTDALYGRYNSTRTFAIPGLASTDYINSSNTTKQHIKYVPQGLCIYDSDYMLITAYDFTNTADDTSVNTDTETGNSVIYVMKDNGTTWVYQKTLVISGSKAHVGGIAYDSAHGYIYVSKGSAVGVIKKADMDKAISSSGNPVSISYSSTSTVNNDASYMAYNSSDGKMYVGNFDNGIMYSYTINSTTGALTASKSYSFPTGVTQVQGIGIRNNKIYISCSYGRNNASKLFIYNFASSSFGSQVSELRLPPMSEGIAIGSSYSYVLFESAAWPYYTGATQLGGTKCPYPCDRVIGLNGLV